jgi:hypothetical protein
VFHDATVAGEQFPHYRTNLVRPNSVLQCWTATSFELQYHAAALPGVLMYDNPQLQYQPTTQATVPSAHSVNWAHLAHFGVVTITPLRIRRPHRMPDQLTLSGHLIQDPPLLTTFVCSHAGACVMPCRVHDGPTRMHTSCPRI